MNKQLIIFIGFMFFGAVSWSIWFWFGVVAWSNIITGATVFATVYSFSTINNILAEKYPVIIVYTIESGVFGAVLGAICFGIMKLIGKLSKTN